MTEDRGQLVIVCAIVIVIACLSVNAIDHSAIRDRPPVSVTTDRDRLQTMAQELRTAAERSSGPTPASVRTQFQKAIASIAHTGTTERTVVSIHVNETATDAWASNHCPLIRCPTAAGYLTTRSETGTTVILAVGVTIHSTGMNREIVETVIVRPRPAVQSVTHIETTKTPANATIPVTNSTN